ncbi:MAG: thioredoxin domain-containing protein [Phycisphaerales bacterium]|nr:thioredoxin domain-containing protein [Hyphomonadaceae bacterium]
MARLLFALCFVLFAAPASAQSFNAQEQAEIRAVVRDYIIRNPDVLREALEALQERTEAERWQRIRSDPRDFSLGPADAPIVIVEFYDYRCGYCHAALEWLTDISRTRRDVRIVLKELPILTPASMEAASAVIAAMPQGRTWAFHRALMSFPLDQELSSAQIDRIARGVGIDVARMRREIDSPEVIALLEQNRAHAIDISSNPATPLFMINGEVISGFDRAGLEEQLREVTSEVRERRAQR